MNSVSRNKYLTFRDTYQNRVYSVSKRLKMFYFVSLKPKNLTKYQKQVYRKLVKKHIGVYSTKPYNNIIELIDYGD